MEGHMLQETNVLNSFFERLVFKIMKWG